MQVDRLRVSRNWTENYQVRSELFGAAPLISPEILRVTFR
jgi:hypothetical protein